MTQDSSSTFTFFPRPEAHAMRWEELLSPVRHAVRNLLLRLDGATTQKAGKAGEVAASCFLVYGDRGTGKSTVLLSVKNACNQETRVKFFERTGKAYFSKNPSEEEKIRKDAEDHAKKLDNVVWLDMLDLEPLPPGANLLTTVLTRVRNALYPSGAEKPFDETTSILEERADSARHKLDKLISDATLMWEDIHEPDTRNRANRQVAAADIYARFQKQFEGAMDTLSLELGRRRGGKDQHSPIILPIDNIDRSTEHLYSIVKLAQMVLCPHFWLVMAGDRQDVDAFLDRAYWKELIRIGESAGATGKEDVSGEDEALVMARRQAAAASHRLLPPSHRVEVGLVEPEETLAFKPTSVSEQSGADKNIRDLLTEVRLITEEAQKLVITDQSLQSLQSEGVPDDVRKKLEGIKNQEIIEEKQFLDILAAKIGKEQTAQYKSSILKHTRKTEGGWPKLQLIDLFDAQRLMTGSMDPEDNSYYTEVAKLGLRLPARGVLDLWQLAYWVTSDDMIRKHREAEKIARTMLRNVIAESSMPSEIGQCLQEKIIRRNPQGGTLLDFWDPNWAKDSLLRVLPLQRTEFDFSPDRQSTLDVKQTKTMMLMLRSLRASRNGESNQNIYQDVKRSESDDSPKNNGYLLLDLVAAWLTVLHDVIYWGAEDSAIIQGPSIEYPATCVECSHMGINPLEPLIVVWEMPRWDSFVEHDICWQLWRRFLSHLQAKKLLEQASLEGSLPRLLAAGWVACALKTFLAFEPPENWSNGSHKDRIIASLKNRISGSAQCAPEATTGTIKVAEMERKVMRDAADVYEEVSEKNPKGHMVRYDQASQRSVTSMRTWLEKRLPLLLSHLFVPMAESGITTRAKEIIEFLEGKRKGEPPVNTKLAEFWKANCPETLTYIETCYKKLFNIKPEKECLPREPFNDLHKIWPNSTSTQVRKRKSSGPVRREQSTEG